MNLININPNLFGNSSLGNSDELNNHTTTEKILEEKTEYTPKKDSTTKIDDLKTEIKIEKPTQNTEAVDLEKIKNTVLGIQTKLNEILNILDGKKLTEETKHKEGISYIENGEKVIEGTFNGVEMIGPDGQKYSVPANYASKSRLIPGDKLKLTIKENGSFVYKQIGPIERKRITGTLIYDDEENQWMVFFDGKPIKVITAAVTFYKGEAGDTVVLIVPKDTESTWGAIENIIKKQ